MSKVFLVLAVLFVFAAAPARASDSACYEPNFSKSLGRDCMLLKQQRVAVEIELELVNHRLNGKALTPEQEQALLASHSELYGGHTPATYDLKTLRSAGNPALRARQRELTALGRSLVDCPVLWKPISGSQGGRRRSLEPSKTCQAVKRPGTSQ